MTTHYLHHGGKPTSNPHREMYPAVATTKNDGLRQSAHKQPIAFGNTRLLDFSSKDGRRQGALQQYLEANEIKVGDKIVLSAIPEQSLLLGFAWGVEHAEDGIAFKVATKYGGTDMGQLNVATVDSKGEFLEKPEWLKHTDYIELTVTAWPSESIPSEGRFWVTPIVIVPQLGN